MNELIHVDLFDSFDWTIDGRTHFPCFPGYYCYYCYEPFFYFHCHLNYWPHYPCYQDCYRCGCGVLLHTALHCVVASKIDLHLNLHRDIVDCCCHHCHPSGAVNRVIKAAGVAVVEQIDPIDQVAKACGKDRVSVVTYQMLHGVRLLKNGAKKNHLCVNCCVNC